MPMTVLVLAAHPDDAEWYAGGTLANLAAEGARIIFVIATDGCKGSYELEGETLVRLRQQEAQCAAAVIGAEPPIMLNHCDFELDRLPVGHLREQFIRLLRQYRPEVVFAADPFSPDLHPDHRALAWAAAEALTYCQMPLVHPEHRQAGLEPHTVSEKYYYADVLAYTNKVVDISGVMRLKLAMLAEHKSQMKALVDDVAAQARRAGLGGHALLEAALDDPMTAVAHLVETEAVRTGQRAGVRYGEGFRYERFYPVIEELLASQEQPA